MNRKFEKNQSVVVVVRHRGPALVIGQRRIDLTQYKHPNIWAVIPCVKQGDQLVSLKTGKPVPAKRFDEVRDSDVGMSFDYDDGTKWIFTRYWDKGEPGYGLDDRTCEDSHCIPIRCFGEELASPPKL